MSEYYPNGSCRRSTTLLYCVDSKVVENKGKGSPEARLVYATKLDGTEPVTGRGGFCGVHPNFGLPNIPTS